MASMTNGDQVDYLELDEERVDVIVSFIDNEAARANPRAFGGSSTYNRQLGRYTAVEPHLYVERDSEPMCVRII